MLYLVKPDGQLALTGSVGQDLINIARETETDLGLMTDWSRAADRAQTEDDVRTALRYGLAATGGIVVAGSHVSTVERPRTLRALVAESSVRMAAYRDSAQVRMVDDYLEDMMTGWKQHGVELDARVAKS